MSMSTAVSYTHLDVYKRQISDCTSSYFEAKLLRLSSLTVRKCFVLKLISNEFTADCIRTIADFNPPLFLVSTLRPSSDIFYAPFYCCWWYLVGDVPQRRLLGDDGEQLAEMTTLNKHCSRQELATTLSEDDERNGDANHATVALADVLIRP